MITAIDPVAALIAIDLQQGIVALPTVHPANEIIGRTNELARAFRTHKLPIVWVHVTGSAPGRTEAPRRGATPPDWATLAPQLDRHHDDHVHQKQRWGAFLGTDLDQWLRERNVTQIVLTGIATSMGVESTARSAWDLGYNVVLVVDAMTDRDADAHRNSIEKIFPKLGETGTTNDVIASLDRRSPTG